MSEDFKRTFKSQEKDLNAWCVIDDNDHNLCTVLTLGQENGGQGFVNCILRSTFTAGIPKVCPSIEKYPLTDEVYARVCINESVTIDILRLQNGQPSMMGIHLAQLQWQYLNKSIEHVDEAIIKSQTLSFTINRKRNFQDVAL
jgi:hypothetical protein